jgi:serine phosphatase RsbU (regulator of sigma subunit)
VKTSHRQLAEGIRKAILNSLSQYIGEQRLLDDISLLVIKHA